MLTGICSETIDERIKRGDRTAREELAENFLGPLRTRLRRPFRWVRDRDLIDDAVVDAILSYIKHPDRYDPHRMSLPGYLLMTAKANVWDVLKGRRRREKCERREYFVELCQLASNIYIGDEEDQSSLVTNFVAGLFEDPVDRIMAGMVVDDERSTAKFAAVLGIAHLPASEQREIVKRDKDCITKVFTSPEEKMPCLSSGCRREGPARALFSTGGPLVPSARFAH